MHEDATMEPEVIQRAPGELELVRAFVNTHNIEAGRDEMGDADGVRAWLRDHALLAEDNAVGEDDARRTRATREALRALLREHNGVGARCDALTVINEAIARARLTPVLRDDERIRLEPLAGGVDGALGRILAVVCATTADGTWARLKACRNEGCQWAFYDASKNRSATWCSMAICGSRTKVRAYRQRRRG